MIRADSEASRMVVATRLPYEKLSSPENEPTKIPLTHRLFRKCCDLLSLSSLIQKILKADLSFCHLQNHRKSGQPESPLRRNIAIKFRSKSGGQ